MSKRLEGRIALVTGASRGIGRAIARHLAIEGATVVAVARTQGALEELDDDVHTACGANLVLVPEDLRKTDRIDQMAAALYQRFGRLDILVGNAGLLGQLGPVGHIKPKTFDDVMNTNLRVNWELIRYMDPLLRLSDAGRAVFVTSSVARAPRAYWGPYAASKAALEVLVKTWAEEVTKTPLRVNLYDPGGTRTRMREQAFPGEDPQTLPAPEVHSTPVVNLVAADCLHHGTTVMYRDTVAPAS